MTYLYNDPVKFVEELVEGYAAAHRDKILPVEGGVIRRHKAKPGQVVLVIGGGSGHYPAFGGYVGQGLAHGAAMGNVFASPSAQQICSVTRAVEAGGGVLFCYGNYAGDVLNFDQAQARLRTEGIDVRSVVVTDDIASAPLHEQHKRRGIAGTLPVFKAAAVVADAGKTLDEVFHVAQQANQQVRTLGVAFSGCTLPGENKPLFEVADGKMEVGMGIHGESGLQQMATPAADKLAEILVNRLLSEMPSTIANPDGARIGVVLNSLGTVKQEELFIVYRKVNQLLSEHGLIIVEPVVGEFITSFDMAGVSLTLFWLNDALEKSWGAAADAPGFHRGHVGPPDGDQVDATQSVRKHSIATGSADSQAAAAVVLAALEAALDEMGAQKDELGRLDAVAGDGDHGMGMHRGLTAAVAAAKEMLAVSAGAGTVLTSAGDAWSDQAGGTSGALWGVILRGFGQAFGDQARPDTAAVVAGVSTAVHEVQRLGKAQLGDKTLVDVLHPFSEALANGLSSGLSMPDAWAAATTTANEAAQATQHLLPKIGRARPHAEKSVGTPDPGAVSMALIIGSVDQIIRERCF